MARLSPIVDNFIILRERYLSKCAPDEIDSIDASLNSLRVNWNAVNLEFKTRFARYEKSSSIWKQFHRDLKELTLWLTKAENRLAETKFSSGEINVDLATQEQHVCLSFNIEATIYFLLTVKAIRVITLSPRNRPSYSCTIVLIAVLLYIISLYSTLVCSTLIYLI